MCALRVSPPPFWTSIQQPSTTARSSSLLLLLPLRRRLHRPLSSSAMGDNVKEIKVEEKKKIEAEKPETPLQPPEKPLPGDCCGSGCMRCVWDVYYEELEAYNKSFDLAPLDAKNQ
ncbi:Cytochrome-b5 reductase protein [Dioscorea alata]|uniref:Cytochrome-b5 reductase protein n=1 Tax=Dioscorea alata TaxID=55571 RepID=A0ACB7WW07_DIOAL|nr:Cytochrome-b5 reductase protein [Dioscorea alata]